MTERMVRRLLTAGLALALAALAFMLGVVAGRMFYLVTG